MLVALPACAPGEPSDSELDPYLCTQEDLGDEYQELTRGEFTPRDLANLADDADSRERDFRTAGMKGGQFVFFKQSLEKPPFEPPINVVCQVTEFESEEAAQKWVAALERESSIDTIAIAWIPEQRHRIRENDSLSGPARLFEVSAGTDAERLAAGIYSINLGHLVSTVAVGLTADAMTNEASRLLFAVLESRSLLTDDPPLPK